VSLLPREPVGSDCLRRIVSLGDLTKSVLELN